MPLAFRPSRDESIPAKPSGRPKEIYLSFKLFDSDTRVSNLSAKNLCEDSRYLVRHLALAECSKGEWDGHHHKRATQGP